VSCIIEVPCVLFKVFGFGARELRGKGLKECFLDML
jgi:hypothetical protein